MTQQSTINPIEDKIKCLTCFDNKNIYTCGKDTKHFVCQECLRHHIEYLRSLGKTKYKCIYDSSEKCGIFYDNKIIDKLFPPHSETVSEKIFEVPTIKTQEVIINDDLCDCLTMCTTSYCPTCHLHYIRVDGCNIIICENCETSFCHFCFKIVTSYHHFRGGVYGYYGGECDLFTNENKLVQSRWKSPLEKLYKKYPNHTEYIDCCFENQTGVKVSFLSPKRRTCTLI